MIRQMLVGIDGSDYSEAAMQYGLHLAQTFAATLHGLHVVDIVQVESPFLYDLAGAIGAAPQLHLTGHMQQALELRGQHLLHQVHQVCEASHVPCVTHLSTGVVPTEIVRYAQGMDLVILGRGGLHTRLSKALLGSAVEAVVRQGATPTLVTTYNYYEVRKPLLATDGSPSAVAALHFAAQFVQALGLPLRVVHCAPSQAAGQACLHAAETHLAAYPIDCEVALCRGNAHEDLVHYILEQGCDLLFMGAFGHRRLVEWVLGSTTQYLLRMSPGPILLCHGT
jgi:nucleotide-binding universal stress UspA family protein